MVCEAKNFDTPDDSRSSERGQIHEVNLTGITMTRLVLSPGWRWSTDVKPRAGTDSCQVNHTAVVLSGRFHYRTDDGVELDLGPGDVHVVSPGHDSWVVGEEDCVIIDVMADEA
jgi:hypothetical protein